MSVCHIWILSRVVHINQPLILNPVILPCSALKSTHHVRVCVVTQLWFCLSLIYYNQTLRKLRFSLIFRKFVRLKAWRAKHLMRCKLSQSLSRLWGHTDVDWSVIFSEAPQIKPSDDGRASDMRILVRLLPTQLLQCLALSRSYEALIRTSVHSASWYIHTLSLSHRYLIHPFFKRRRFLPLVSAILLSLSTECVHASASPLLWHHLIILWAESFSALSAQDWTVVSRSILYI